MYVFHRRSSADAPFWDSSATGCSFPGWLVDYELAFWWVTTVTTGHAAMARAVHVLGYVLYLSTTPVMYPKYILQIGYN
jgi:hypothetical protein